MRGFVIPAQAGIQEKQAGWIPTFVGMTSKLSMCQHSPGSFPQRHLFKVSMPIGSDSGLPSAFAFDHCPGRLQQQLQVGPERALVYVLQVKPHHVVEGSAAAPLYLPEASDAGLRFQPAGMPGVIVLDFVGYGRPRPYQGHGARQHVEQLWEFVKTCFA